MNRIAKFEKVSFEQFKKDFNKCVSATNGIRYNIEEIYNNIELPRRATIGSAGYDFKIPFDAQLKKETETLIPTGIRVKIDDGWVLKLYPRSGLGFKRGLALLNTVGVIDGDYYYSDNEGHIMAKVTHTIGDYLMSLKQGDGFIQGVFVPYGITCDDDTSGVRNGGFGSTDHTASTWFVKPLIKHNSVCK